MSICGAQPLADATEVVATVQGVGQVGRGCSDIGEHLCGGGSGGSVVWVGDVGDENANWEASGRIKPQGGPHN